MQQQKLNKKRITLLTLRQKTKFNIYYKLVEKPKRAIPQNALPGWQQLPLHEKLPMLKCPNDTLYFSRNKCGKSIYNTNNNNNEPGKTNNDQRTEFNLSDPNCHDVSYKYEPLHDPYMDKYFRKSANLQRIKNIGIVTDDNEVLCTLKEFNEYRRYLQRLYVDGVNNLRSIKEMEDKDRQNFEFAETIAKKFAENYYQREEINMKIKQNRRNLEKARQKRLNRLKELKNKYYQIIDNVEKMRIKNKISLQMKSNLKDKFNKDRQYNLAERNNRRIILLKKKLASDAKIIKDRRHLNKVKKEKLAIEKINNNWNRQLLWKEQNQRYNNKILLEYEELQKINIMRRNKQIEKNWKKNQHQITLKLVKLIQSKYKPRNVENFILALQNAIRKFIKKKQSINNQINKQNDLLLVSTNTNSNDDKILTKDKVIKNISKNKTSKLSNEKCNTSDTDIIDKIKEFDETININNIDYMGGLSPIVIPYEPQQFSSIGLIDSTSGYGKIKIDNIRSAVTSTYNKLYKLDGNINSMNVLIEANNILNRLAYGENTLDLPKDEAIKMYVIEKITDIIYRLKNKQLSKIDEKLRELINNRKNANKGKSKKNISKRKDISTKFNVKFQDNIEFIGTSAYEEFIVTQKSTINRPPTPSTSLNKLADTILDTPNLNDVIEIPDDMKTRELCHLYGFQKRLILQQLKYFEDILITILEKKLISKLNFETLNVIGSVKGSVTNAFDPHHNLDDYKIIDCMTQSILTLPENDNLYANTLVTISHMLCNEILNYVIKQFEATNKN